MHQNPRGRIEMVKLYTRTGDQGTTGLLYGGRVSKDDARTEAYGTVDEACSALGLARALTRARRLQSIAHEVQRELVTVSGELATVPAEYGKFLAHFKPVTSAMVERLETWTDELGGLVTLPAAFVVPGGSAASAAFDVARTVVRRAERQAVGLNRKRKLTNPEVLRYLNRLSSLLFIMARYEDRALPMDAVTDARTEALLSSRKRTRKVSAPKH